MDLHDELNKHGASASEGAAQDLVSVETRQALGTRVRRGRRTRALGGAGVVAGVVAAGVLVWGAVPGSPGLSGPAGVPGADSWTLDIDGASDHPVADAAFGFDADMGIGCGTTWTLEPGVTVHDVESAQQVSATVDARTWVETDAGDVQSPRSMWAGFEVLWWEVEVSDIHMSQPTAWTVVPIVLRDGVVVAEGGQVRGSGFPEGEEAPWFNAMAASPLPGQCWEGDQPTDADGEYQVLAVVQAALESTAQPVLTAVVPLDEMMVDFHGLDEWWDSHESEPAPETTPSELAPDGSAELRAPDGDTYQAFVVRKPMDSSCTPLADLRESGEPFAGTTSHDVVLPGLEPITSEWWGAEPVAIVEDDSFAPWYLGDDAWVLADSVSAGDPSVGVRWTRESNYQEPASDDVGAWRLLTKAATAPPPGSAGDCAFDQPIPEISGATWLIIDGADWDTLSELVPNGSMTDDVMTWIYLGEA